MKSPFVIIKFVILTIFITMLLEAKTRDQDLVLIISPLKKSFNTNDPINIELKIMNKSSDNRDWFIYSRFIIDYIINIEIRDLHNNIIPFNPLIKLRYPTSGYYDLVLLFPNKLYGTIVNLRDDYINYQLTKGKYKMRVRYNSKIACYQFFDKNEESLLLPKLLPNNFRNLCWPETLESNEIEIVVD